MEMLDKLQDVVGRYEVLMGELAQPDVANDTNRYTKLMKEQAELAPLVEKYKEYEKAQETIDDSLVMLEEENDEEMRQMLKEEMNEAKETIEKLENDIKI